MLSRSFSVIARQVSTKNPRIAVVGSGPAGLYTTSGLINRLPQSTIDIFDRSAVPYGLVQYGVAPDHYDVKRCTNQFEKLFRDNRSQINLFCNVQIGSDVTFDDLCRAYDIVVLAYGANRARRLQIPGSNADNCLAGADFVSWYNGGCTQVIPDLNCKDAVIIGNGNVALDCARILLSSPERLALTDIPEPALNKLRHSRVSNVRIFGRRGPKEASFTIKELRELLKLDGTIATTVIDDSLVQDIEKSLDSQTRPKKRILQLMLDRRTPANTEGDKQCHIEFFQKPVSINTAENGHIESVVMENTISGEQTPVPCGLLIYAIGYENIILPGAPVTPDGKLLLKDWCRVDYGDNLVFATGWCAHTPSGVIAQTQSQAVGVAEEVVRDVEAHWQPSALPGLKKELDDRKIRYLTFDDWLYVDSCERTMGRLLGKLREKIKDVVEFIQLGR